MKKSIILIAVMLVSFATISQNLKEEYVPVEVKNAFQRTFPNMKKVIWEKEEKNYVARYQLNKITHFALLNKVGEIVETKVEINIAALPKEALLYIRENFKNAKIIEALKITTRTGTTLYKVHLKSKKILFDIDGNYIKTD